MKKYYIAISFIWPLSCPSFNNANSNHVTMLAGEYRFEVRRILTIELKDSSCGSLLTIGPPFTFFLICFKAMHDKVQ